MLKQTWKFLHWVYGKILAGIQLILMSLLSVGTHKCAVGTHKCARKRIYYESEVLSYKFVPWVTV